MILKYLYFDGIQHSFLSNSSNIFMKFFLKFHVTPLFLAVLSENIEIIKILLSNQNIDVNIKSISKYNLYKIKKTPINIIQKSIF